MFPLMGWKPDPNFPLKENLDRGAKATYDSLKMSVVILLFLMMPYRSDSLLKVWPDTAVPLKGVPILSSTAVLMGNEKWGKFEVKGDTLYLLGLTPGDTLRISYLYIPAPRSFTLIRPFNGRAAAVPAEQKPKSGNSGGLRLRGSKSLSLALTEGSDLRFDQSTYIEISGITPGGLAVRGVLQDRDIGRDPYFTRELSQIDKTYLSAEKGGFRLRLGDTGYTLDDNDIKAKGISLGYITDRYGLRGIYGFERGKFQSVTFNGETGKQGPYFLGEGSIYIVPGSEKVYLNGVLLKRGREKDYYVDYERGSITFTPRHPISSRDRITVEYQYRGQLGRRYIRALEATYRMGPIRLSGRYSEAGDDKNFLRDYLSDEDLGLLDSIGDTSSTVYVSGARYVGPGEGDYVKAGDHFRFVGQGNGDYRVRFTYFGPGEGDYAYDESAGKYIYLGSGQGEYLPLVAIEIPGRKANYELGFELKSDLLSGLFRLDLSDVDRNVFSSQDDEDNLGRSYDFQLKKAAQLGQGQVGLEFTARFRDSTFSAPLVAPEPLFEKNWGVNFRDYTRTVEDMLSLFYRGGSIKTSISLGRLSLGRTVSRRGSVSFGWTQGRFSFGLKSELIKTRNPDNSLKRFSGTIVYRHILSPFLNFEIEKGNMPSLYLKGGLRSDLFLSPSLVGTFIDRNGEKTHLLSLSLSERGSRGLSLESQTTLTRKASDTLREFVLMSWNSLSYSSDRFQIDLTSSLSKSGRERWAQKYIYVGPGRGNFSYDTTTSSFYENPQGDYVRTSTILDEVSPGYGLKNSLSLEIDHRTLGILYLDARLNFGLAELGEIGKRSEWANPSYRLEGDWSKSLNKEWAGGISGWISRSVFGDDPQKLHSDEDNLTLWFSPSSRIRAGLRYSKSRESRGQKVYSLNSSRFAFIEKKLNPMKGIGLKLGVEGGTREKQLPLPSEEEKTFKTAESSLYGEIKMNLKTLDIKVSGKVLYGFVREELPSTPLLYPMTEGLNAEGKISVAREMGKNSSLSLRWDFSTMPNSPPGRASLSLSLLF